MRQGTKRRVNIPIAVFICLLVLDIATSLAQDLSEIARKERERQKNIPHPAKHIYTNEDLARPKILVPEDRATIKAEEQNLPQTPDARSSITTINSGNENEVPLGDVARHYRMLKRLQEIQQADKTDVLPGRKRVFASPTVTRPAVIIIPKPPEQRPLPEHPPNQSEFTTQGKENEVRVSEGDSLWKLAKRHLGDGMQWTQLLAANPQLKDPNVIHAGDWIQLPQSKLSTTTSRSQVRVKKGDSLWKLAQTILGSGFAWSCFAQANPEISNANLIYSGQVLTVPAHCASARTTARLQ